MPSNPGKRLHKGVGSGIRETRFALQWTAGPFDDLTGLRVVETDSLRLGYGARLVAYNHLPHNPNKLVFYLPGPDDPPNGTPCNLDREQFLRRELPLTWLTPQVEVEQYAWVREFSYAAPFPNRPLHRQLFGGLEILAYSEVEGQPAANGRWYRRLWAWKHCPKCTRVEGVTPFKPSGFGDIAVDPTTIRAGHESSRHDPSVRVKGSIALAAVARRDSWIRQHSP